MTSRHEIRQLAVGQFGQMGCHGLNCDAYVFIAGGISRWSMYDMLELDLSRRF